jgi:hypothetical protein
VAAIAHCLRPPRRRFPPPEFPRPQSRHVPAKAVEGWTSLYPQWHIRRPRIAVQYCAIWMIQSGQARGNAFRLLKQVRGTWPRGRRCARRSTAPQDSLGPGQPRRPAGESWGSWCKWLSQGGARRRIISSFLAESPTAWPLPATGADENRFRPEIILSGIRTRSHAGNHRPASHAERQIVSRSQRGQDVSQPRRVGRPARRCNSIRSHTFDRITHNEWSCWLVHEHADQTPSIGVGVGGPMSACIWRGGQRGW